MVEFLLTPRAGSFGTIPKDIQAKFRHYQDLAEATPDKFMRYDYKGHLDSAREAVAKVINAPPEGVVFVNNATEGVNTVLKNLTWAEDGKDTIIWFSTAYGACAKIVDYLVDYFGPSRVSSEEIVLSYPVSNKQILQQFRDTVAKLQAEGKRPRVAMFDVVSSLPGVVFPWVEMVAACKELGILSLVDGAQGIGMVELDVTAVDPDFFISNCHKWLFAPRGCAVFYAPVRNHSLLPTTLCTSHGYEPRTAKRFNPLPPSDKSAYVTNFEFVGTKDNSMYYAIKDAIQWRQERCGGEKRIVDYIQALNKDGTDLVAKELGTEVLENEEQTLRKSGMGCVALPLWIGEKGEGANETDVVVPKEHAQTAFQWIQVALMDHKTFIPLFILRDQRYWVRLSAQIYLDLEDYKFAAKALQAVMERVRNKEYLKQ